MTNAPATLVLDEQTMQPIPYLKEAAIKAYEAFQDVYGGNAHVLKVHGRSRVRSTRAEYLLPAVIVKVKEVKFSFDQTRSALTHMNLWLRDKGLCVYCMQNIALRRVTMDHVTPQAEGGLTSWQNIVAACQPCNGDKGHTPLAEFLERRGIEGLSPPHVPTHKELLVSAVRRISPLNFRAWREFLESIVENGQTNSSSVPPNTRSQLWNGTGDLNSLLLRHKTIGA